MQWSEVLLLIVVITLILITCCSFIEFVKLIRTFLKLRRLKNRHRRAVQKRLIRILVGQPKAARKENLWDVRPPSTWDILREALSVTGMSGVNRVRIDKSDKYRPPSSADSSR